MSIVTSISGYGNQQEQALIEAQRAAEAAKAAAAAKDATVSGNRYLNLRNAVDTNLRQPQRDTNLLNLSRTNADKAAAQSGKDRGIYQNLINGTGRVLGADQAIASANQANAAQQALTNTTRGGLYAQAGAQQNSQRLQEMQTAKGMQEAARMREEAKIMGAGMMGNSLEASRATEAQRMGIEQANAANAAKTTLGFRGIQDAADMGLSNLAFNQDLTNQQGENKLASAVIGGAYQNQAEAAAAARAKRKNQGLAGLGLFGL